ncbi:sensor histidine kinase [Nocardia sp. NPDC049149]|uniref:sensor histidine kinase n=1 Tax=Nocardia sp. NPDC049149 TaxID=3364315 RepID=UPI0037204AEB
MGTVVALAQRWSVALPHIRDIGGPFVITGVALLAAHSNYASGLKQLDLLGAALIVLSNLPVVFRNRAPIAVFVLCCTGMAAFAAAGYWEALNGAGVLLALYTVAARYPPSRSVPAAVTHTLAQIFAAQVTGEMALWMILVLAPQFSLTAWMLGNVRRLLVARNERLAELTEQLDRDRIARARRAVVEERVRLARELHDVVAHHMSAISIQAGLARYVFHTDPSTAYSAVQAISDASGKALEDMRRLLTLLRVDPDRPQAVPLVEPDLGVDRLDELVDNVTAAGVPVTKTVTGTVRRLAPGPELCIYRIVQESLTNVLKHAGSAHVRVTITYRVDDVVVEVVDNGSGVVRGVGSAAGGQGLIGMRERAKLYGGTLTAGALPQKGFRVMLTLPMSNADEPPADRQPRPVGDGRLDDQRPGS